MIKLARMTKLPVLTALIETCLCWFLSFNRNLVTKIVCSYFFYIRAPSKCGRKIAMIPHNILFDKNRLSKRACIRLIA